jgi:GntR family transcriptional repressor for pyruvate dehydrogenase complex
MKPVLRKVQTVDKVELAVEALHKFIVEGNMEPGAELPPENEMAKQIGVSKFSMREALRVAQSQGLIEISQGRRTKVADVSIKPAAGIMNLIMRRSKHMLLELTEARQSLECEIVRFAAIRASDTQIRAMAQTIEDLKNHRHDIVYCVNKDIEFHDILVQATNNRVFGVMLESLAELSRESRLKTMRMSGIDKPIAEHRAILEAIKARDPENAIICMQKHLQTAELNLKEMANSKPRLSDDKLDKLKVLK